MCYGKTECNGKTCLFPEEVALCFPSRNRMLLFPGTRLHGVLVYIPPSLHPLSVSYTHTHRLLQMQLELT
jgi:hypothetical protein